MVELILKGAKSVRTEEVRYALGRGYGANEYREQALNLATLHGARAWILEEDGRYIAAGIQPR
jgi:hypothetical protein